MPLNRNLSNSHNTDLCIKSVKMIFFNKKRPRHIESNRLANSALIISSDKLHAKKTHTPPVLMQASQRQRWRKGPDRVLKHEKTYMNTQRTKGEQNQPDSLSAGQTSSQAHTAQSQKKSIRCLHEKHLNCLPSQENDSGTERAIRKDASQEKPSRRSDQAS